jgi:hypothetical protein
MPIDSSIILWCVFLPMLVMLVGSLASRHADSDVQAYSRSAAILGGSFWFAMLVALYGIDKLGSEASAFLPEYSWALVIYAILASAFLISPHAISTFRYEPGLWVLTSLVAVVSAAVVMPTGPGWEDTLPMHKLWIPAVSVATICNSWALHRMCFRNADRWVALVILAGLACPALIGAATFSALFHLCLAAIAVTTVVAIFAALGRLHAAPAIIFPSMLIASTMVSAGRFNNYSEVPKAAYAVALFCPSLVAMSDRVLKGKSVAVRLSAAAITAVAIIIAVAVYFLR